MAGFCVVTEIYHVSPLRNPSCIQQRLVAVYQRRERLKKGEESYSKPQIAATLIALEKTERSDRQNADWDRV